MLVGGALRQIAKTKCALAVFSIRLLCEGASRQKTRPLCEKSLGERLPLEVLSRHFVTAGTLATTDTMEVGGLPVHPFGVGGASLLRR